MDRSLLYGVIVGEQEQALDGKTTQLILTSLQPLVMAVEVAAEIIPLLLWI